MNNVYRARLVLVEDGTSADETKVCSEATFAGNNFAPAGLNPDEVVVGVEFDCGAAGTGDPEVCNGVDDDCDAETDEGFEGTGVECVFGQGECTSTGHLVCTPDGASLVCAGKPPACDDSDACTTDTCADETGCVHTPIGCDDGDACTDDACEAATGCVAPVKACDDSNACTTDSCNSATGCEHAATGPTGGTDETCDGLDDDCDGATDDDYLAETTSCGVGLCAATGATSCSSAKVSDSCTPGPAAESDALCDGADNDCDGEADEDFADLGEECSVGDGACAAAGVRVCAVDMAATACDADPATTDGTECDDADPCTSMGACSAGGCVPGASVDTEPPAVTCPAAVEAVADATTCAAAVTLAAATATDMCSPDAIDVTSDAPATWPLGVTTVTFTAQDAATNQSTCTTLVTVLDTAAPTVECNAQESASTAALPLSIAGTGADACGAPALTVEDVDCQSPAGPAACEVGSAGGAITLTKVPGGGTVSWTLKAVDGAGNETKASCTLTLLVETTRPTPMTTATAYRTSRTTARWRGTPTRRTPMATASATRAKTPEATKAAPARRSRAAPTRAAST